jgi:hypothetical protein
MTVQYQQALDAALILKYGDASQGIVAGLNKVKPYGFTRSVITVEEFRNEMGRKLAGSGDLGMITLGGNWITWDTLGQDTLRDYALNNTKFTDARVYLNNTDFFMPDIASDATAGFQVTKFDPGEATMNDVFSLSVELLLNGQPSTFTIHETSTTMVIAGEVGGDTLTDANATFITDGVLAGDTVILEGVTATEDELRQVIIASLSETVLTFTSLDVLTDQATGSSFTIHAGHF